MEVWVRGVVCDIPEHLHDLCVLLAIFLEGELTLLVVVLVLSTSSVLSSLSLILRHIVLLSTLFDRRGGNLIVYGSLRIWW